MDLGRRPEARYPDSEVALLEREIAEADIAYVVDHIGSFGDDNRAGIERTLHRISAIRNRNGKIVGLTCRIGRAVYGTIEIIADFVETGKSLLIMGRPGIGKTTMLREAARVLADDLDKRVVVVDTSNEIAGDGDIPHPAIGKARRMQVRTPSLQHEVMIEAVENHMPQVIVIDEIGTELEAQAARTIAERGVQLIGTAHGNTLDNLMLNPTLSDLIGGIQSVTLGDEEARRRRTQKSVLERKAPPTFDVDHRDPGPRARARPRRRRRHGRRDAPRRRQSRRSCAGATRRASTARSRGRGPRRASSSRPDRFSGLIGSAAAAGAPSPAGAATRGFRGGSGVVRARASAAARPGLPARRVRLVAAGALAGSSPLTPRPPARRRHGAPGRGAVRGRRHRRPRARWSGAPPRRPSRARATRASCRGSASGASRRPRRSTRSRPTRARARSTRDRTSTRTTRR